MGELLDAKTAAAQLRVDVRTLYAYVSRGALRRVPGPDGHSSRYDSDEVDLLVQRSRPRSLPRPPASIDLVIATDVSTVTDGMVRYRGVNVNDLIDARRPFERVAELLWQTDRPADDAGWRLPAPQVRSLRRLLGTLDGELPVMRRFASAVAAMAHDPASGRSVDTDDLAVAPDWAAAGRHAIVSLIEASGAPPAGSSVVSGANGVSGASHESTVAGRLWQRWSPLRPTKARVRAMDTALVLLAEHELALSTLAVRVAASARATPAACLLAGLACLEGDMHGGAGPIVHHRLLASRGNNAQPRGGNLGFGHVVHRHGDPRAKLLLDAVYAIATSTDRRLFDKAQQEAPAPPNTDFALAALAVAARMPTTATTAIFAVARTAGWIAHAAEEYTEQPLRFRGAASNHRSDRMPRH